MKINSATFLLSAPDLTSCPESDLAEFAFIGRSNVGKSSMINLLTGKTHLAKVSKTPGLTKLINFFTINNAWTLVDLPGYGYAKVAERHRTEFNKAVADYLQQRQNLRLTFVLIDSRLTPQRIDLEFLTWIASSGIPFALVFTKIDKLKKGPLQTNMTAFMEALSQTCGVVPPTFTSSSLERVGRNEILDYIGQSLAA
jgi:GTP-binding protein